MIVERDRSGTRSPPLTVVDAATALRGGTLTSRRLTEMAIARADSRDGELGVFLARFDEAALEAAAVADEELGAGHDRGLLHGIPIALKDIIACADGPTTAQSLVLDLRWGGQGDAPVVRRLRRAGSILLGKTTTMEFAVGCPIRRSRSRYRVTRGNGTLGRAVPARAVRAG